jgi:uncharacterized repeat protein (TIGR03803 family)
LYGETGSGGPNHVGTVFEITTGGTLLQSFDGLDGISPSGGLVRATDGNFYGTTVEGGGSPLSAGTVFKVTPKGKVTTLHSFCPQGNCSDGEQPDAGLCQARNGNLYGTTQLGGAPNYGTVFRITAGGTLTTIHSFNGTTDGSGPAAALIQAADGSFYGTTPGTVFRMTAGGRLTTLHTFDYYTEGGSIIAGLVQATDGNFYGVASGGGAKNDGTVFKITPEGVVTILHNFDVTDGYDPEQTLVQATDGNLYGTTLNGGAHIWGTLFKITLDGTFTTLYSFCAQANCSDGSNPSGALIQDTDGNLYGTTSGGGTSSSGTIFSLAVGLGPFVKTQTSSGKEGAKIGILGQGFSSSSVVKFGGTQATTIALTGTTFISATVPSGALTGPVTVTTDTTTLTSLQTFKVVPTVTSIPVSGSVGTPVAIAGTGLTQTTKVTFGGVAATSITVNSDMQVTATVPTGAKTGKIVVTTKGGSAPSKTSFTVD